MRVVVPRSGVHFQGRQDRGGDIQDEGPTSAPMAEGILKQLSDGTLHFANWDAFKQTFLTQFGHHNLAQDSHDKLLALCNDDIQKKEDHLLLQLALL